MNLEFDALTVSDLLTYASKQGWDLGATPGLRFLRGKNLVEPQLEANDVGKSTLLKALCWCIYGRTPENLRGPDLKPWSGKGTPTALLDVTLDGTAYTIAREAKTNGLYIDGKEVGPDAAAELIGLSFETFTNTILLAQGQPLFFDRSPKDKMALFSDVLNLERWEDRSKAASDAVRELETLKAELEGELTGVEGGLTQAEELLEQALEASSAWEEGRKARLKTFEKDIKAWEAELKAVKRQLDPADLAYDSAETELKALRATYAPLNAEVGNAKAALSLTTADAEHFAKETSRLRQELQVSNDLCPTCGQPLVGKAAAKQKATLKAQLEAAHKTYKEVLPKLEAAKQALAAAALRLNYALADTENFEKKSEAALTTLQRLQPQAAALEAQLKAARAASGGDAEERNPHNEHVRALRSQLGKLSRQIEALKGDLSKATRQIERNHFWVKGFKDVKLYLVQEVLEELQLTTNVMLSEIGLEGWEVRYSVEKEAKSGSVQRGINVVIIPAYGYKEKATAVKWEAWGGGVGQRLRLAGALALSEVLLSHAGVQPNLEILDEPTRGLSRQGVSDLCEYLRERAQRLGRNVWLVDHMAHETSKFAGGALVTKTDKGSGIENY